jgi:hypothetical protein
MLHQRHSGVCFIGIDQESAIERCKTEHEFGAWYADDFDNPRSDVEIPPGGLVICADVLEHLEDPDSLLQYLKDRVLPSGMILLSTPDRDALRGIECFDCPNAFHVREWNSPELVEYLSSRGFEIQAHFHQLPVGIGVNWITYNEVVRRLLRKQRLRYNQVCLMRVAQGTS